MEKKFLILLISITALFACEASESGTKSSKKEATATSRDEYKTDSERVLIDKVRLALRNDPVLSKSLHNLNFKATGGSITLRGTVNSEQEKNLIESKVKSVSGIREVDNQIIVASKTTALGDNTNFDEDNDFDEDEEDSMIQTRNGDQYVTEDDRALTEKIRESISKDTKLTSVGNNFKLLIDSGDVTITGIVETDQQRALLGDRIKKLSEVKSLDNQLKVIKKTG